MTETKHHKGSIPKVCIGMIGYGFIGKAHINAYKKIPYIYWPPVAQPYLKTLCGIPEEEVRDAVERYGFQEYATDWKALIEDKEVQIFDNCGPNNIHYESCIAAAKAGKHIFCEKPLGRNAKEAKEMLDAVNKAGVKHMCGFNYRFVPAVRFARDLIGSGELGEIYHFRSRYLQEWITDPKFPFVWRLSKKTAGSGALGDLGAHSIDLARFLIGEPKSVLGLAKTFIKERLAAPGSKQKVKIDVDDAVEVALEFENGAVGTMEASRFCPGKKSQNIFEISGSKGSLSWDMMRLNELQFYSTRDEAKGVGGSRTISVTESFHPYYKEWWPHGHILGWEHTVIHEIRHFLEAVVKGSSVAPYGATFEDGYKCAVICDAILESSRAGKKATIRY